MDCRLKGVHATINCTTHDQLDLKSNGYWLRAVVTQSSNKTQSIKVPCDRWRKSSLSTCTRPRVSCYTCTLFSTSQNGDKFVGLMYAPLSLLCNHYTIQLYRIGLLVAQSRQLTTLGTLVGQHEEIERGWCANNVQCENSSFDKNKISGNELGPPSSYFTFL